ncbi:caspase domain-containing protein [Mariannaea sp. PMI_226]|nr:caspase domain-containing protein [Mariannaea sp. PMI_226]
METQRRFALLVGINYYKNDDTRKSADGTPVRIRSLGGCLNDVESMKKLLRDQFQLDHPRVLTSSPSPDGAARPLEPEDAWPTFNNIQREFRAVINEAKKGDLFFFHYSGHGATLPRIDASPSDRSTDPSLLTFDYGCDQPAVRGWQLNQWLKELNDKRVQVVAILDSCHSGGSWRSAGPARTPEDFNNILSSPNDQLPLSEPIPIEPSDRNARLATTWGMNPEGFTLMAACTVQQQAQEVEVNNVSHGAFTHELVQYFQRFDPRQVSSTYRLICDMVAVKLRSNRQDPEVYGQDALVFFGNFEPFHTAPQASKIEGDTLVIPMGRIHGMEVGTEFKIFPPSSDAIFVVDSVGARDCRVSLSPGHLPTNQSTLEVVPSRWSLGDEPFKVYIEATLGTEVKKALWKRLQQLLVSTVQVEYDGHSMPGSDTFRIAPINGGGVEIYSPHELVGYRDPLRCVNLKSGSLQRLGDRAAVSLGHLARFGQILDLPKKSSKGKLPFHVTLDEVDDDDEPHLELSFENTGNGDLYLTVVNMTPGFSIKQLWPPEGFYEQVPAGGETSFAFEISIPDQLRDFKGARGGEPHRDIIRAIVTSGQGVSWKSLELPELWEVDQMEMRAPEDEDTGRNVRVVSKVFRWWMVDMPHYTPLTSCN